MNSGKQSSQKCSSGFVGRSHQTHSGGHNMELVACHARRSQGNAIDLATRAPATSMCKPKVQRMKIFRDQTLGYHGYGRIRQIRQMRPTVLYCLGVVFFGSVFLSADPVSSFSATALAALPFELLVDLAFLAVFPSAGPSGLEPTISSDSD